MIIEEITEVGCFEIGEGPHWDVDTHSLYFVDFLGKSINKYVPATKQHTQVILKKSPSFIIPVKESSDRFVISLGRDLYIITWDGISDALSNMEIIGTVDIEPELKDNTFNDGKVDVYGNLWTGTLNLNVNIVTGLPKTGSLYSVSQKQIKKHFSGVSISNGLTWSKCSKKFYYNDSSKNTVDEFDYDAETLTLSNRRSIFSLEKHGIGGVPDGMTTDAAGNLWVALFQGNKVLNISTKEPESLLGFIDMPESIVTSVCFGGKNLDELYVTTAGNDHYVTICNPKIKNASTKPVKGGLYKITGLGVKGLPAEKFSF
ncbi:hypothetical protein FQR65_LT08835 [Abscondita terminalis]|nr:hypothetical protein FQR65_LT08835 [Abscondita terminalis]